MELSKKKIVVSVTTTIIFDARAACSILSLAFSSNGKYRFGKWCEDVKPFGVDMEGHEDMWLPIPCGGALRFRYEGDNIADLTLENLASGFSEWYQAKGHQYVPLRMNANHELYFDPYGLGVQHPELIDEIIQWSLFGYYKYPQNTKMHCAVVCGGNSGKQDLEAAVAEHFRKQAEEKADPTPQTYRCNKCVKERFCVNKRPNCTDFKRDPPDGGFYG